MGSGLGPSQARKGDMERHALLSGRMVDYISDLKLYDSALGGALMCIDSKDPLPWPRTPVVSDDTLQIRANVTVAHTPPVHRLQHHT